MNGEIVAALTGWQGLVIIALALLVHAGWRRLRQVRSWTVIRRKRAPG